MAKDRSVIQVHIEHGTKIVLGQTEQIVELASGRRMAEEVDNSQALEMVVRLVPSLDLSQLRFATTKHYWFDLLLTVCLSHRPTQTTPGWRTERQMG